MQSFGMYVVAVIVFGLGEGLYLSVDMALAAAVLPNPDESAKDMGVLNIGNALSATPCPSPSSRSPPPRSWRSAGAATTGRCSSSARSPPCWAHSPSSSSAPSGKPSPSNSPLL
ncbi:hypothetical protein ACFTY8_31225 [Streptomyces mirabilis]|uniref:hypothetical protein n=1 Tax=Streptomyces mirabilis TaxID=68239 RepID=UPI003637C662